MMGGLIFLIFIFLFVVFMLSVFSVAEGQRKPAGRRRSGTREFVPPRSEMQASLTARRAMRRAGYEGDENYVSVVDIGLLAYRDVDSPTLIRTTDAGTDTQYLRPFVALSVPYQARGTVHMEILDDDNRVRYADETRYDLELGKNTLLPGTWLPIRDDVTPSDPWLLRVSVGETLLAVHSFGWQLAGDDLHRYIEADGEISPELQQALDAQASQAMSLSQLLSAQDD